MTRRSLFFALLIPLTSSIINKSKWTWNKLLNKNITGIWATKGKKCFGIYSKKRSINRYTESVIVYYRNISAKEYPYAIGWWHGKFQVQKLQPWKSLSV